MRKNFTLLFLMGIFGLFTTNLFAQQDATIDPADIRYWIGEGENQAVLIVNWAEPDTALAWGYRFEGEMVTVQEMMDKITEVDSRLSYTPGPWGLGDILFNDGTLEMGITAGGYWMFNVDGEMAQVGYDQQTVANNNYVKWGDTNCGTMVDPETWAYVWEAPVAAVYPLADESTIDPDLIRYWVGEGENEVVFAVNWNEPDTCLAWGYRFSEENVTVKHIMDALKDADPRFDYVDIGWGVGDIYYTDANLDLALYGTYWMYNVNGSMAMLGFDQQTVENGDFIKWGDESCATEIAQWSYVWTQEVEPVWMNTGVVENQDNTLSVYPNPAVNETFVTIENAGMNTVSLYDMQGRLVNTMSVDAMAGEQVRLSIEMLNSGVYFVTVSNESAVRTAKLVVK